MREWIVPDNDIGVDGAYFDYQELLRCKDCKKYRQGMTVTEWNFCSMTGLLVDGQDFCSRAERKEE